MTAATETETSLQLPVQARTPGATGLRSPKPKVTTGAASPESSAKEKNSNLRDNAVTMQLTKTKMCAFFERGKCASANCRYAHSEHELRVPPNLQKTKLCRAYLSGGCNDENCDFAHGETDLRVTAGIYKTQICNFFERGYCKKGDRCNHAHGANDLRPPAPMASTPGAKTSPSKSGGDSSRTRRSPLPLAELLVDNEANVNFGTIPAAPNFSAIPPTPTKSVTELASLAFSPMPSTPMWGQYGVHPLSPMSTLAAPSPDLASMWPARDAVDMLVEQRTSPIAALPYAMVPPELPQEQFELRLPEQTPQRVLDHLPVACSPPPRPAPGLTMAEPPLSAPPALCGAPGLGEPPVHAAAEATSVEDRDSLVVSLSERLASLDAVVQGLQCEMADFKSDPAKRLHRI